ncbi:hypothetical protein AAF712_011568 [Marasmius tenuissimus]|uniref:Uncharacterized protein n=1 Tax=Marasmius tenuissimus TaxID=585030 RepID=A0ABR2ZKX7_9AGAR
MRWPTRENKGKVVAISNSQIQPKRAAQKSLGTKTTGVGAGQTSTAAQCSPTIVSDLATRRPKPSDQGTKSLGEDFRDYTPGRPTRLEARGKKVVVSSLQARPKTVEQKSLGTKAAAVKVGQKPTPARCTQTTGSATTTPNRPKKQPQPEDCKVTPPKPALSSASTTRRQTELNIVEQRSLGTKAAGVNVGQKPIPARRTQTTGNVIAMPNKPKAQPRPEDRKVTPAKATPSSARTTR